ncbi:MAG TPA: hypothetical protein VH497_06605 [Vicinamibacterales bacterium]|jgi:uncharacterized membrane protein (UPF0136 family)
MRRFTIAAGVCLLLTVFHTWPIAAAPQRNSLNHNADAQLTAWIVSWIAYALPHEPRHLFAGNIFQPDSRVLAYSEPFFVPALMGAPIRWLGGSAVLTNNVLILAGLWLSALAGWWVVQRWTGSFAAGLVAGSLVAFNSHHLTRLPHLQAAHVWGLPLAFYATERLLCDRDPRTLIRRAVILAIVIAAIAATSVYWLVFAGAMVFVEALFYARSRQAWLGLVGAGVVALLVALPVLWPYLQLAGEGTRRPLEQAAQLSATPSAYLVSLGRLDGIWSRRFFTRDIDIFFPGFLALLLAGAGVASAARADTESRTRAAVLIAIALLGFVLSLGPATIVYRLAYSLVLPLQGLRVPARFGYLPLFSIALLAGLGVAALEKRMRSALAKAAVAVVCLAGVTAEAWHGPVQTVPFKGVPAIYKLLDAGPQPALLVEAPFWPSDAVFMNGEYVLNATEHRTPIMNGYSGVTPDLYRKRALWFWFFPEQWAIDTMRKEGATHVMVHLEQFANEAESVKAALAKQHDLELVAADQAGHLLYRFLPKP